MSSTPNSRIDRKALVRRHNILRHHSSPDSPIQVGNGRFAFGVDVTGLQTFIPFSTMAEWGWKNDPLPPGLSPEDFSGKVVKTQGRDVRYEIIDGDEEERIGQWLRANPNRMNLARIGLWFGGEEVVEGVLDGCRQVLDLWCGVLTSEFLWQGEKVVVETTAHPELDAVGIKIESSLMSRGKLGVFFDFPYNSGREKFSAPYVGDWEKPHAHTTTVEQIEARTTNIKHCIDDASYYVGLKWESDCDLSHLQDHRYILQPCSSSSTLEVSAIFHQGPASFPSSCEVALASRRYWPNFWSTGGIIDLGLSLDPRWLELERRIILSQYLTAVNCAGSYPPQESGLVNLGWYGKFHMEMYLWHSAHLALFNRWSLLDRSLGVYHKFLPSARALAEKQAYQGARWPKMTDPSGRMAPGEINALLVWQQPHAIFFAELHYRAHPQWETLEKWKEVIQMTADFMASYATLDEATGLFNLGPPLHIMSENTDAYKTVNPAFELQYWRWGLSTAVKWWQRMNIPPPKSWISVVENLASVPSHDGLYVISSDLKNTWTDYNWEHPSLAGIYGLIPSSSSSFSLDLKKMHLTSLKIWQVWDLTRCWGWDFPLLALNAARSGHPEKAVEFLLHQNFVFDDAGLVEGTSQVPKPYFPGNGSLLYAVAFMAAGWDGDGGGHAPGFPEGWTVRWEDLETAI